MLSILIGHSYFLRLDRKQFERAKPYPPLATLQVAALLRAAGHRVSFFDAMLAEGTAEFDRQLHDLQPQLVLLYEDNFNYLSKMCLERMRRAACEMIGSAERAGCRIIAAGSDASDSADTYLDAGADLVLLGEGVGTLLALVSRLDGNLAAQVANLTHGLTDFATRLDGKPFIARGATLLPAPKPAQPAWDLVDMGGYRALWQRAHGYFSLNMAASRGCSFRCNWCAKPIWGNRYLQRPAREVVEEMAFLKQHFQPDHLWFADDIFGFRVDWVSEFAAAARAADALTPFTIQTRADLISVRMAQALKAAGCHEAWIGAESGSQRILDAMDKGTTIEEILTARERLREQGIRVGFFIQLGYLGEELEDIVATRQLIDDARPDDIGVSVSYPLPGTRFHDRVKEQLGDKTRWNESDDLSMMFQGTYRSEFYKAVRDLLHDQVNVDTRGGVAAERQTLQRRWDTLLSNELGFRASFDNKVAAAGA